MSACDAVGRFAVYFDGIQFQILARQRTLVSVDAIAPMLLIAAMLAQRRARAAPNSRPVAPFRGPEGLSV